MDGRMGSVANGCKQATSMSPIQDRCPRCGGTYHGSAACPTLQSTITITTSLCRGYQDHDFAVGLTHAICNRCEKVIKL